jgi:RNA-directed DNA polymerase
MRKSEPNSESGNPTGPSAGEGANPVSKRAAIAAKARKNPKEQFNNLLHHLTYELVAECLREIPQSSAAGVDGMSVKQASGNLSWLLPPILKQIHEGRYTPPPVRRVYIRKADGSKRPIGVPAVIDRAIQAAMVKILNEIYEQDFLKCSFGFRPGLSCHHALATINEILYRRKMEHVLEVDIRDFLDVAS